MTDAAPSPSPSAARADSQHLVNALFASAPDALVVLDGQGRVALMNQAFERLWGFPPEVLARRDITEVRRFIAAQLRDPQAYLDGLQQLHAAPPTGLLDEVERLDGRILERHVWPLDLRGLAGAVVARWRDVTALRLAQRAVHAAQARLAALFEHAAEAILLADDHGTYLDANPAACTLLGRPREALQGLDVGDVIALPAGQAAQAWRAFLAAGHAQGEVELKRPDGQRRVAHFSAVARIQPGVHLSILSDVTDAVRERQRAREVATQMEMAAAHASLVFFIVDLRDASVVLSDPAWAQHLLGYPPATWRPTPMPWTSWCIPTTVPRARPPGRRTWRGAAPPTNANSASATTTATGCGCWRAGVRSSATTPATRCAWPVCASTSPGASRPSWPWNIRPTPTA